MLATHVLAMLGLACSPEPGAPSAPASLAARSNLVLDQGWSGQSSPGRIVTATTFELDEVPEQPHAVLVLDGMWWRATVTINGNTLPVVTAGASPGRVELKPYLRAGQNTLSLSIEPPDVEPTFLSGGHSQVGRLQPPALNAPPRIELRPSAWIANSLLRDGGTTISGMAKVNDAPRGSKVRFQLALDGRILAPLGESQVVNGRAQGPGVRWSGPMWGPKAEDDGLLMLVSELLGPDGTVLDVASERTGVRRSPVTKARRPATILAARVDASSDPVEVASRVAAAGLGTVELHGRVPSGAWLATLDELGMPALVMPHCSGRLGYAGNGEAFETDLAAYTPQVQADYQAMIANLGPHPSLSAWVVEGGELSAQTLGGMMAEDPRDRMVLGWDVPGVIVNYSGSNDQAQALRNAWVIEVAYQAEGETRMTGAELATWASPVLTSMVHELGSVGGVLWNLDFEALSQETPVALQEALRAASLSTGAELVEPGPRRGSSFVTVSGARPGQTVWLRAPLQESVGAIANSRGQAHLGMWFDGPSEVVAGETVLPVELEPTQWVDFRRQGEPVAVVLPGG